VTETGACPGCGALVPDVDGPVHKYVPSSPGCWKTFGEVQADEAHRFGYPPAHRVVVDAYMAQHAGDGSDRRDRQSVFVHLVGLCAVLERSAPPGYTTKLLSRAIRHREGQFPVLRRSHGPGPLTVLHMVGAADLADYERRAREWATSVWTSWSAHHDLIRSALRDVLAVAHGTSGHSEGT
jgi:hypothetical protein